MPTTTMKIRGLTEPEPAVYLTVEVGGGLRGYMRIGPEWWLLLGDEMREVKGDERDGLEAAWAEYHAPALLSTPPLALALLQPQT